ncbi:biopolymer transporter ExbD [Massilia sp. W12]|uniref:ExbD/TolR family protein n=1 Tax=Massilia sp. W12 TaxID=3126507 RepID=UPI0030CF5C67
MGQHHFTSDEIKHAHIQKGWRKPPFFIASMANWHAPPRTSIRAMSQDCTTLPSAKIDLSSLTAVLLALLCLLLTELPRQQHHTALYQYFFCTVSDNPDPEIHALNIDFDDVLYWNGEIIQAGQLQQLIGRAVRRNPAHELHIRINDLAHYQSLAKVLAIAQASGVQNIGLFSPSAYDHRHGKKNVFRMQ